MSWKCWNCGEEQLDIHSEFSVCLECGAGKDGSRDLTFEREVAAVKARSAKHRDSNKDSKDIKCFVATAAYGSSYASEVLVFRRFRDEVLQRSNLGRTLVNFYYLVSPSIASLVSKSTLLRAWTKYLLLHPLLWLIKRIPRACL
jgi:hypothetical protein